MRLANLIPNFLKPILIPKYYAFRYLISHIKGRNYLHRYWRQPWDNDNLAQDYLVGEPRSLFLGEIIKRYTTSNARILEIGCNVGRNLNYLFLAGFKELSGIEISEKAVQLLKQSYPKMASRIKIYNAPVEELIKHFKDLEFEIVFTMAVLQHIHTNSSWIFPEIARITRDFLIVIEDERTCGWRHFPRNYKKIFESFGMKQIEALDSSHIEGLGSQYFARVFARPLSNA